MATTMTPRYNQETDFKDASQPAPPSSRKKNRTPTETGVRKMNGNIYYCRSLFCLLLQDFCRLGNNIAVSMNRFANSLFTEITK